MSDEITYLLLNWWLSRRVYEEATSQLVSFLDLVSDQLCGPSRAASRLSLEGRTGLGGQGGPVPRPTRSSLIGSRLSLGGVSSGPGGMSSRSREGIRLSLGLQGPGSSSRDLDILRSIHALRDLNADLGGDLRGDQARDRSRLSLGGIDLNER